MPVEYARFPYLTTILLACIAGLMIIVFLPPERKKEIKLVSVVFSGITLIVSVYLYIAYDKVAGGLQFAEKVVWVKPLGITYFNAADGFSPATAGNCFLCEIAQTSGSRR